MSKQLTIADMRAICDRISYKPGYSLLFRCDHKERRWYIQVECERVDTYTGSPGYGWGGKAYLSEHMTPSEIVRRAFGLFASYEEHECREFFTYKGVRVFGPHIDVDALVEVGTRLDVRKDTADHTQSKVPDIDYHLVGGDSPESLAELEKLTQAEVG